MAALLIAALPSGSRADPGSDPFNMLLGSWRGTGEYTLDSGATDRLKCNAYYTGGGSKLGMAIRCTSDTNRIEIRSKLSKSGDRITGNWEERTYNAEGAAAGHASGDTVTLQISGAVSGTMSVQYSRSRQIVSITTENIAFRSINIALTRS